VDVTTSIVGKITTRNCAIVCIWTFYFNLLASFHSITMRLMTNINSAAIDWSVGTRVGEVGGSCITSINSASIVVIANGGDVCVHTACCWVASIGSARIVVITGRAIEGSKDTLGSLVISLVRPEANMSRAHVSIATITINHAGRRRAKQVCVSYISICWVAHIEVAVVTGRNSDGSVDTALDGITSPSEAVISYVGSTVSNSMNR